MSQPGQQSAAGSFDQAVKSAACVEQPLQELRQVPLKQLLLSFERERNKLTDVFKTHATAYD